MTLFKIQQELKVPKSQTNKFGGYKYRSCEDILNAIKPLLEKYEGTLKISDEIVMIGERFYVKTTVSLKIGDEDTSVTAYAREPESKKGMGEAQITGSSSSYARKYALNGLFAIDDTKDDDHDGGEDKELEKKTDRTVFGTTEFDALEKKYKEDPSKYPSMEKLINDIQKRFVLNMTFKDKIYNMFKEYANNNKKQPDNGGLGNQKLS